jgi:hypothetical protein
MDKRIAYLLDAADRWKEIAGEQTDARRPLNPGAESDAGSLVT